MFTLILAFVTFPTIFGYEGCGKTRSCFGSDPGCLESGNCYLMVAYIYSKASNTFQFEMQGDGVRFGNYIALGLSDDSFMGDDLVFYCTNASPGTMGVSWNNGKSNSLDISNVNYNYVVQTSNGITLCNFTVIAQIQPFAIGRSYQFDLASSGYYLFLATGSTSGYNLNRHSFKVSSGNKIDLKTTGLIGESSMKRSAIKAHGCLMALAWIASAPSGKLFAKAMKKTWRSIKPMGKDLWFLCHQFFMGFTILLTFVAFFVMIGIEGVDPLKLESLAENYHAAFGMVGIVTAFIQPIMAAFRPSPDSPNRPIFNWAHRINGYISYIFSLVALFMAMKFHDLLIPGGLLTSLAVYKGVLIFVLVGLTIQSFIIAKNSVEDGTQNDDGDKDEPGGTIRKVIVIGFIIYAWVYAFAFVGVLAGL